jgi:hypothetical protein
MLVSQIISDGRSWSNVPNTNFFTAADALTTVQTSWIQVYAELCSQNDDYFVTQVYTTLASLTPDANRTFFYNYALPADFYRLRLFQYQPDGQLWFPVEKMTLENYGNLQTTPGYRLMGTNLVLYTTVTYTNWCIFYYPAPVTLATNTDLTYPNSMIPELLSWQVAVEIRRKQNLDYADKQARVNELMMSMRTQLNRDDAKAESIKNVFGQGISPYI